MDNNPAEDQISKGQNSKIDLTEMLSDLRLMHCMVLQKEIERLESESDGPISAKALTQIKLEYDGRLLRLEREVQVRTQQMEQGLQKARAEIDHLLKEETVLRSQIDQIYNSKSMRVTAPLRKLSQLSRFWRK